MKLAEGYRVRGWSGAAFMRFQRSTARSRTSRISVKVISSMGVGDGQ